MLALGRGWTRRTLEQKLLEEIIKHGQ